MRVTIVGRGRVGRGLASAAKRADLDVKLVRGGTEGRVRGALVVLAVPDPVVADVAAKLEVRGALVHCSGSLGVEVLRGRAPSVGVMHPLVSFADPERPPSLRDATFVLDGDDEAVKRARKLARRLGARPVRAQVHGPAYHAAAALGANGAAALAAVAVRVLEAQGMTRRDAERAMGALLRTVGENVETVGVPTALSGPVIRGDAGTVRRHREALEALDPGARRAYDAVGPAILECAREAGLDPERAAEVARALTE
ncbi:MAG: DUF2520 domain-containing protein [Sandaracinaceae bacterium]